jgi:hypothetical protein
MKPHGKSEEELKVTFRKEDGGHRFMEAHKASISVDPSDSAAAFRRVVIQGNTLIQEALARLEMLKAARR